MKHKISFSLLSLLVIFGLLAGACVTQPVEAPPPTDTPVSVAPIMLAYTPNPLKQVFLASNLKVLTTEKVSRMELPTGAFQQITAQTLAQANGTITVPVADLQAVGYTKDQILTSGVTQKTPYGLLRKVVAVQPIGGNQVELITVQATLEEAIQSGDIDVSYSQMVSSSPAPYSGRSGGAFMRMAPKPMGVPIDIPIDVNAVLYDDGQGGTVKAKGNITVTPDFSLHMSIDNMKMQEFEFINKTTVKADMTIESKVEYSANKSVNVYKKDLANLEIPVAGMVVVITPRLEVNVGLNGQVSTGISFGAQYNNTIQSDAKWITDAQWDFTKQSDPVIQFTPPAFKTRASAKVYIQPSLNLMLFGVVGPYAQLEGYLSLEASPQNDPWWTLQAGVNGEVGVKIDLFGFIKLNPFHHEMTFYKVTVTQAPANTPVFTPHGTTAGSPGYYPTLTPTPYGGGVQPPVVNTLTFTPPPPPSGNENVVILYDAISVNLVNISHNYISAAGIEFRRVNSQGAVTASFNSDRWKVYATSGTVDALPAGDCFMLNTQKSSRPSICTSVWGFITTYQSQDQFWIGTADSTQFQVWKNGKLLKICQISTGSCRLYVPQP